jgi:hypothetical protein
MLLLVPTFFIFKVKHIWLEFPTKGMNLAKYAQCIEFNNRTRRYTLAYNALHEEFRIEAYPK